MNAASEKINSLKSKQKIKTITLSPLNQTSDKALKALDTLLIEKQDQLEEYQERLENANKEINNLRNQNELLSYDLDKAELMLEEYHEKNQEQENLIIQLGEQYKEELIAKE